MTLTRDTGRLSEWLAVLDCTTVHSGANVAVKKSLYRICSNNRISTGKLLFLQSGIGTLSRLATHPLFVARDVIKLTFLPDIAV